MVVIRRRRGGECPCVRNEHTIRGRSSLPARGVCLVSLICVLAVVGCGGGSGDKQAKQPAAAATTAAKVTISNFKFKMDPIRVKAGGTVTWTNKDSAPHTAQTDSAAKGAFKTGTLKQGGSRKVAFRTPGSYKYFCSYHRFMTGTVEVTK